MLWRIYVVADLCCSVVADSVVADFCCGGFSVVADLQSDTSEYKDLQSVNFLFRLCCGGFAIRHI